MPRQALHRHDLPQLDDASVSITDGGLETCLIFDEGVDLPHFAAFPLLRTERGRELLGRYFRSYLEIARRDAVGLVLDTPTWRANADWAARLGYGAEDLAEVNRRSVSFLAAARDACPTAAPVVVSGCVGPRGDGYVPGQAMAVDAARDYHLPPVMTLADAGADLVSVYTMTSSEEAAGAARAAAAVGIPVVVSFTVETDGALPTGRPLREAVEQVDALTDAYPVYYMINCAHPTHFAHVLAAGEPWMRRIRGIRANASTRSHAELDNADELDAGDPADLAQRLIGLRHDHPHLTVLGGCCGTGADHIAAISARAGRTSLYSETRKIRLTRPHGDGRLTT